MKKTLTLLLLLSFLLTLWSPVMAVAASAGTTDNNAADAAANIPKIEFSDVGESDPGGDAIYKLAAKGVINGNGDGTFKPDAGLTRAQACKIINLVFGFTDKSESGFPDVSGSDWFYEHVLISKKIGYITGHANGLFGPAEYISRQQVCIILVRIFSYLGTEITPIFQNLEVAEKLPDWSSDQVLLILSSGLMALDKDGSFRPEDPITRRDFCVLLANFVSEPADPDTGDDSDDLENNGNGDSAPGGGNGSGGISNPPSDNNTSDDPVVLSIRNVYTSLQNSSLHSELNEVSAQIVSNIARCLEKVLADSAAGKAITPEYVKSEYSSEISTVKSLWSGLTSLQQSRLQSTLIKYLDSSDLELLLDYFIF